MSDIPGEDLVICAPCATACAAAPLNEQVPEDLEPVQPEEASNGVD